MNGNIPARSASTHPLSALRSIEALLRVSIELLRDAEGIAKEAGLDSWYAARITDHANALDTDVMPEVRAAIEKLEAEARP